MADADTDDRPKVELKKADLNRNVSRAWIALMESRDPEVTVPPVMVRGSELVRWTERGELEGFNQASLTDQLSFATRFWRYDAKGEVENVDPPGAVAQTLLARDSVDYVDGPRVDRVVDVPVLGSAGRVIDRPGHHPEEKLLYVPAPELADVEAGDVTRAEYVEDARDLLMEELLVDFGFTDDASKANALGLLLTPFVREYIGDNPTPLHLIVAPEPGTGKTLLAQAALTPGCGLVPLTPETKNEEEMRKRITSQLVGGARAIVFDNIAGSITSSVLAGAITSGVWTDRELGHTKQLVLPVRNVWVATGNNLDLTDEHMRRVVPIMLDPGDVRPSERPKGEYTHADLLGWARKSRGRLVAAALTLVHHWAEGDAHMTSVGEFERTENPTAADRTLGSFERWGDVVGGILAAADVKGFLGNLDQVGSLSTEREDAIHFLEAWHDLAEDPVTAAELKAMCQFGGVLRDHLPEALQVKDLSGPKLGYWLREHRGATLGGYRLIQSKGGHSNSRKWSVQQRA
jgi:putative DNA primase/helicase